MPAATDERPTLPTLRHAEMCEPHNGREVRGLEQFPSVLQRAGAPPLPVTITRCIECGASRVDPRKD